jgi:hypothetical protein
MTTRKFYKTIFKLEVLSEDPIPEDADLRNILKECTDGGYSGDVKRDKQFMLNGRMAARALENQHSDPGFFRLTKEGEDADV